MCFVLLCCAVLLCWGKYGMVSVWLGSVGSTAIYSTVQLCKCRKSTVFAAFGFTFLKSLLIFSHCCIYGWFYLKSLSFSFFFSYFLISCPFLLVKTKKPLFLQLENEVSNFFWTSSKFSLFFSTILSNK